jgi:hypothetical protein
LKKTGNFLSKSVAGAGFAESTSVQRWVIRRRIRQFVKRRTSLGAGKLTGQRRRCGVQVRLEHTGHVGLIGKPASQCHLFNGHAALSQQSPGAVYASLDNVSVRSSAE